jgi:hypothetical protein
MQTLTYELRPTDRAGQEFWTIEGNCGYIRDIGSRYLYVHKLLEIPNICLELITYLPGEPLWLSGKVVKMRK